MNSPESPLTDADDTSQLTANFSETARALFSAGSVSDTLQLVVDVAVATIDGCDYAGIFLIEAGEVTTPVQTGPLVADADALQQRVRQGPCLDAVGQASVFYAEDLLNDRRWPRFGPEAADLGVRSLLALPLSADATHGALNLYARYPSAFSALDRARGLLLAALAGLAFTSARSHAEEERRAENLHAALSTRELIGQAQGILMERERITADAAFDILRRASQHLNVKLREVARDLVDTGERPQTGAA